MAALCSSLDPHAAHRKPRPHKATPAQKRTPRGDSSAPGSACGARERALGAEVTSAGAGTWAFDVVKGARSQKQQEQQAAGEGEAAAAGGIDPAAASQGANAAVWLRVQTSAQSTSQY